jgi:hypothetical protein
MSFRSTLAPAFFSIDDDVPIPDDDHHRYPLHQLEVGQSFFVPDAKPESLARAIRTAERRMGRRFTARIWTQPGVASAHHHPASGTRVWRMPDHWSHPSSFENTGLDSDDGT